MSRKAFQDYYPDNFSHCYGCGKKNEHGHHLKSYWDGDTTVAATGTEILQLLALHLKVIIQAAFQDMLMAV